MAAIQRAIKSLLIITSITSVVPSCSLNEYVCASGGCVLASLRCDGHDNCLDGSDEMDCVKKCKEDEFLCRNHAYCIPKRWRCDNIIDCADHSDEENCEHVFSGYVYGIMGGSVELSAAQVTNLTNVVAVTWKHNKEKAAQWIAGEQDPLYYDIFKNVTKLDTQTWALHISNLQPHFSGNYSVELNNKDSDETVGLIVLNAVSQPNITQVCNPSSCTLTCKATEDGHSQYTWTDSRGERKDGPVWTVENRAEDQGVTYTCNVSNPVSWAIGTFTVPGRIPYEIYFIIAAVLVVLVLIGIGIWIYCCLKRKTGKMDLITGQSSLKTADIPENVPIHMKKNGDVEENSEPSQELLSQTHEPSDINNGTVAELPNGTCSEATIQTDGASNSVHGHATNAENGDASHEVVMYLHELSCSGNRTDATAENGDVTPDLTSQPDTKEEVPKPETSEVVVENGETSDDANSPFLYQMVI